VADLPPLPSFLIIGAQKSGTRYLRFNLGEHPEIFTPENELMFFDHAKKYRGGVDSYREMFEGWDGQEVIGEATPGYMMWRLQPNKIAERIDTSLPDVRLIAVLRNPVDRAYSAFVHHMRRGRIDQSADFMRTLTIPAAATQRLGLLEGGWYASSLAPYVERFGDRLQVTLNEELTSDPAAAYRKSLIHIGGVDHEFVPDEIATRRFANAAPPRSSVKTADGSGYRPLTDDERADAHVYFEDEIVALQRLVGIDLSVWDPPSSASAPQGGRWRRSTGAKG